MKVFKCPVGLSSKYTLHPVIGWPDGVMNVSKLVTMSDETI